MARIANLFPSISYKISALLLGLFFSFTECLAQQEGSVITESLADETDEVSQDSLVVNYISKRYKKNVITSYYSSKFNGRKTSSGAVFNNQKFTAAHRTLPFGTKVRLTNPQTQASVIVEVNDRGPFSKVKEIDITQAAFKKIAPLQVGLLRVDMEILTTEPPKD